MDASPLPSFLPELDPGALMLASITAKELKSKVHKWDNLLKSIEYDSRTPLQFRKTWSNAGNPTFSLKDLTKDERVVFIQYCRNYIALCKALVDAGGTAPSSLRNDIATLTRYVIDTIALDQPNDDGERPNNDTLGNQFGALSITSPDVRAKLDLENEHSSIEEEVCEVDDIPAVSEDLVSLAALPLCSCCQEQINMSISQYVPRVLVCGHVHCTGCILSLLEAEVMTCQTCFENTACINVDALPVWTNSSFKEELTSAKKTSVSESISSSRFRSQLFSPTSSALSSWTGVYFAPLGEGSFGQTSLWYMPSIMVIVVLKRTDDDEAKTLMRSEHIILTKLCHPNIIQTYGIFNFQDAYLALALPYYPDGDVANFLKENSWCTAKVMFVMLQITSVNCYLLVNNLCHGDFKPENFLISGDCKVVVADFGACGCIGDEITVRTDAYADREETHFSEFTDSYASARCLMAFATRKAPCCFEAWDGEGIDSPGYAQALRSLYDTMTGPREHRPQAVTVHNKFLAWALDARRLR